MIQQGCDKRANARETVTWPWDSASLNRFCL
jgi:hypothetical protein